jgi:hypothetical protein
MSAIFHSVRICRSVGIMYTLWAGRSGGQFLIRSKELSVLERRPDSFSGPLSVLFNGYVGRPQEVQRPVRVYDSSCPSSIDVKNKWS